MDIEKIINEAGAAVRTLNQLGYTYHGAEYWKPPLGIAPLRGLIDGNAYQFTTIEENTVHGVYSDEGFFKTLNVEWSLETCTNIKLLEVK